MFYSIESPLYHLFKQGKIINYSIITNAYWHLLTGGYIWHVFSI